MHRPCRWLRLDVFVVVLAFTNCGLPKNVVRPRSSWLADTRDTTLGQRIGPALHEHASDSGFLLFNTGEGAIQARVALADVAQSSIDAQYFQWAGDTIGRALLEHVIAA